MTAKLLLCLLCSGPVLASGQDTTQRFNLHFQTTYIYQYKPAFRAAYSGLRSLNKAEEKQNSLTATGYLGIRLWNGAAFYINPELAGGSGLSGASGMGGSTNGETFRVGNPAPTLYLARAYVMQTLALSRTTSMQEDEANQLAVRSPDDYLQLIAGKLSLADIFDINTYSNSPRTQFINWSLMNNGAWDFAANVRGYTYVLAGIVHYKHMDYRLAFAALPTTANGPDLETDVSKSLSVNAEIGRSGSLAGKAYNLRLLGYYNNAPMGNYRAASRLSPVPSDLDTTRAQGHVKWGLGANADYAINNNWGLFARLGWNDGQTETWCFTEIDRTAALGISADGHQWHREEDEAGIAVVANGLSAAHKDYLVKGGNGFVLGDGQLNYAPEAIAEAYYSCKPKNIPLYLSGDYQFCLNPGYNKDRGPAHVFSFRLHVML